MIGRGWSRRVALIVACAASSSGTTAAQAQVSLTDTNVSTLRVNASTRSVIYYLDMRNDSDTEQAFSVRLAPPRFATVGGRDEGRSIDGPRQLALQGPGRLGQLVQDPVFSAPCSDRDSAFHGYATGAARVDILLPARAATTLAVRYATGRRAPWSDSDYRLRFTVNPTLVGDYVEGQPFFGRTATLTSVATLTTSGPLVGARPAAHILLDSTPRGGWGDTATARRVSVGDRVAIRGRILPVSAGRTVVVQTRRGRGTLRTLTRSRTDARGRFRASWTATGRGLTEIWARYPTQPGPLRADSTSCPLRFSAR